MLVYFPEKRDPRLAETSELSYGLLVPSQFEWYGAVSAPLPTAWGQILGF